jgi:hypothetical protein
VTLRTSLADRRLAAFRHPSVRVPSNGKIEEKAVKTYLLCAVALGLAGAAASASAQSAASININTTVGGYCANLGAGGDGLLALGAVSDDDGRVVTAFPTTAHSISGYYCNKPAKVTLTAAPLMQQGVAVVTDDTSFTNRIDYQANLVWDDVSGSDPSASAGGTEISSTEANIGNLVVTVSNPDTEGNRRPIAGDYKAAVTLTVALIN